MQFYYRTLLIAAAFAFSPISWAYGPGADAPLATDAVPYGPPSTPTGGIYERGLAPEDITSIDVPANPVPQMPPAMDITGAPTSLWTRIRLGFGLPDVVSPLVREQEDWYASRPDYIRRTVARSSRYLHYIVEEIQKRGMPTEIALLPIIESAYNPVAYSRAHASGIWQFIPSTGKLYGLQQDFWYDGRRDVIAATNAALDYLQKLYDMFGSWELALASYNWGEGAVSRAIARNQARGLPTDYQSLTMPTETRYYVPKLQAVKNIIANPAKYGIELAEVPNQPYFTAVTTTRHIDVKLAARLADMPVEEFRQLNPGHNRPVIRADQEQTLLLPTDKADIFRANLESHREPLASWQTYTLKAGDKLERVASRHGISLARLKEVNSINPHRRVGPGTTLLVPGGDSVSSHLPDLPSPQAIAAASPPRKMPPKNAKVARKAGPVKSVQVRKVARKSVPGAKTAAQSGKRIVLAQQSR